MSFSGRQRANRWLAEVTPRSPAQLHSAIGPPGLVALAGLEATQLASDVEFVMISTGPEAVGAELVVHGGDLRYRWQW